MNKRAFVVACFLLGTFVTDQGRAQNLPGGVPQSPTFQAPLVTNCWTETQYFSSLKTGDVEYCRGHMKYVPGAPDCYTFETQVCAIFQPLTREWTQSRQPLPPRVFACPNEAKPPLCPSNPARRW